MNSAVDPRRADKVNRFKPTENIGQIAGDDLMPDYMNILGMSSKLRGISAVLQEPLHWLTVLVCYRNDFLDVRPYDEAEMVCLAGAVLFLH